MRLTGVYASDVGTACEIGLGRKRSAFRSGIRNALATLHRARSLGLLPLRWHALPPTHPLRPTLAQLPGPKRPTRPFQVSPLPGLIDALLTSNDKRAPREPHSLAERDMAIGSAEQHSRTGRVTLDCSSWLPSSPTLKQPNRAAQERRVSISQEPKESFGTSLGAAAQSCASPLLLWIRCAWCVLGSPRRSRIVFLHLLAGGIAGAPGRILGCTRRCCIILLHLLAWSIGRFACIRRWVVVLCHGRGRQSGHGCCHYRRERNSFHCVLR